MNEITEIVIRGIVAFMFLMMLAQFIGKQMVGHMGVYGFVAAITLGSIAGNTAFNLKIKFSYFILSLVISSLITYLLALLSMKSRKARKWISGEPEVVIENGKILEHTMGKMYYTIDSLNQGLRKKDIFDINEVELAILEPDGTLSVLKKAAFRNATKTDLNVPEPSGKPHPIELVRERRILSRNLQENDIAEDWLIKEMNNRGYAPADIFYAVMGTDGHLFFDRYQDQSPGSAGTWKP